MEKKKMSKEQLQKITDKKVEAAKRPGAWVLEAKSSDTHLVMGIVRQADMGVRILRDRADKLGSDITGVESSQLIQEYNEVIRQLNAVAEKICTRVGMEYRTPKDLQTKVVGNEKEAKADKKAEAMMEGAYSDDQGDNGDSKKARGKAA